YAAPQLAEQVRLARPGGTSNDFAQRVVVLLKPMEGALERVEYRLMNVGHMEGAVVGPDAIELGRRRKICLLQGSECLRGVHGQDRSEFRKTRWRSSPAMVSAAALSSGRRRSGSSIGKRSASPRLASAINASSTFACSLLGKSALSCEIRTSARQRPSACFRYAARILASRSSS